MSEDTLQESEKMVAAIISHLAPKGVLRDDFGVSDLGYKSDQDTNRLFVDALEWLSSEGVVRSNDEHPFTLGVVQASGFTLTSRGYRLLAEQFSGDLTLGQAIQNTTQAGTAYSNAGSFAGGLLGGFVKSVGG